MNPVCDQFVRECCSRAGFSRHFKRIILKIPLIKTIKEKLVCVVSPAFAWNAWKILYIKYHYMSILQTRTHTQLSLCRITSV